MDNEKFSLGILRQKREQLGYSIEEVVQKLNARQIKISGKTLYGYENGVGAPKVNTFIALCDIYGIDDILGAFGVRSSNHVETDNSDCSFILCDSESKLLNLYRKLNSEGQSKLLDYADDLVSSGKYIKSNTIDLGQKQA